VFTLPASILLTAYMTGPIHTAEAPAGGYNNLPPTPSRCITLFVRRAIAARVLIHVHHMHSACMHMHTASLAGLFVHRACAAWVLIHVHHMHSACMHMHMCTASLAVLFVHCVPLLHVCSLMCMHMHSGCVLAHAHVHCLVSSALRAPRLNRAFAARKSPRPLRLALHVSRAASPRFTG
jgi:hypothetical protein